MSGNDQCLLLIFSLILACSHRKLGCQTNRHSFVVCAKPCACVRGSYFNELAEWRARESQLVGAALRATVCMVCYNSQKIQADCSKSHCMRFRAIFLNYDVTPLSFYFTEIF